MRNSAKQAIVIFIALICILAGVLGLVLPLLPGLILLILGFMLLSLYSPRVDSWLNQFIQKNPWARDAADSLRGILERIIRK